MRGLFFRCATIPKPCGFRCRHGIARTTISSCPCPRNAPFPVEVQSRHLPKWSFYARSHICPAHPCLTDNFRLCFQSGRERAVRLRPAGCGTGWFSRIAKRKRRGRSDAVLSTKPRGFDGDGRFPAICFDVIETGAAWKGAGVGRDSRAHRGESPSARGWRQEPGCGSSWGHHRCIVDGRGRRVQVRCCASRQDADLVFECNLCRN